MSEKEKFLIDMDKDILKAKNCDQSLLLLLVQENEDAKPSFLDDVRAERVSIMRKTANTREVYFNEDGKNYLAILVPEADKFAQSFIEKKIEGTISPVEETESKKYDILYSTELFPDNGKDANELMSNARSALNKNLAEV